MNYRKQHIISKTYLKHFSAKGNGIGLFIIDSNDKYKRGIQKKNSGDKIFWIKNYSDSKIFSDRKAIEKMFASEIEVHYNKIISKIDKENPRIDFTVKEELLKWIFYTKMRSSIWINHLENFINLKLFRKSLKEFVEYAISMRWKIYKTTLNQYWLTSDNPGFCLNLDDYDKTGKIIPLPIYEFDGANTLLFYPLTKNYCLSIYPYSKEESVKKNATNTNILFEIADSSILKLVNDSTFITQKRLIISCEIESLKLFEYERK